MFSRILFFGCVFSAGSLLPPNLSAQESDSWAGRQVMVVRKNVELKSGQKVVGRARLSELLAVSKVNGDWLWIESRRGWINQSAVVLSDRAIEHFTQQVDRNPTSETHHQRGTALASLGQYEKAVADFDAAIQRDPRNLEAYNDRGNVLRKSGQFDRAISDFSTLIERNVRHPAVYTNRGMVLHHKGEYDKALDDFSEAIRLDRKFAPAWEAGGSTRQAKGDYAKAIGNFSNAIKLDPSFDRAHNNLAWILATCVDETHRNGAKAVEHATKACKLARFEDSGYLDTLAAAHAEAGQFEEAVKRANEAIALTTDQDKKNISSRLEMYKAGKPFHQ